MRSVPHCVALFASMLAASFGASALAQPCAPEWAAGNGFPGVNGTVNATILWDPDGNGPRGPLVAVAGAFSAAGPVSARNIAAWDPVAGTWAALGAGVDGAVNALTALPNGDLVAGGDFLNAGGSAAARIAKWNGSSWVALGSGMPATVSSLTTAQNGDVIAGGSFTTAGGTPVQRIARWDDSSWSAMGTGFGQPVVSLATLTNGDIVAGGTFFVSGGNCIARWNGSAWVSIVGGCSGLVRTICPTSDGGFIAGGDFITCGSPTISAGRIARFNGTSWSAMANGLNASVRSISVLSDGRILAGGDFTGFGVTSRPYIAAFNGTTWTDVGGGANTAVNSVTSLPTGGAVVAGTFLRVGNNLSGTTGLPTNFIAKRDGTLAGAYTGWSQLSTGFNSQINCFSVLPDGTYYVGGNFTTAGGVRANRVAYFNGTNFVALGDGVDGNVSAIAKLNNGDVIVGGSFLNASGIPATGIARWNGSAWSTYAGGVSPFNTVGALLVEPNGDLLVGGVFTSIGGVAINNIARFDGTNWTAVGNNAPPTAALARLTNGTLVAAGGFQSPGQRVVQFNGTSWIPVGGGANNSVTSLAARPDGTFVMGGFFTTVNNGITDTSANRIAIGTATGSPNSWSALGVGLTQNPVAFANTVLPLANGDIFAGGGFTAAGGVPASSVALWNPGTSVWSAMGAGVNVNVLSSAQLPNGDILIGGGFTTAGTNVSAYIGRWTTPTPATIISDPLDTTVCATGTAVFTVGAAGNSPTFHWRKDATPINTTTNPSAATASLTISSAGLFDVGNYDCVVSNSCGSVTSAAAHLTVCVGDFDCSGGVDGDDVIAFFALWDAGEIGADVNGDEGVDGDDVIVFFARWDSGC